MLTSLIEDTTIRFSLWYPYQWPTTLRILADAKVDTAKIITHRAGLDEIEQAIERVVRREDNVIKTLITP
jgi:L-iditol 2-dehydrogenase